MITENSKRKLKFYFFIEITKINLKRLKPSSINWITAIWASKMKLRNMAGECPGHERRLRSLLASVCILFGLRRGEGREGVVGEF